MEWDTVAYGLLIILTLDRVMMSRPEDTPQALVAFLVLVSGWAVSNIAWAVDRLDGWPIIDAIIVVSCALMGFQRASGWRWWYYCLCWVALGLDIPMTLWGRGPVYSYMAVMMNTVFIGQLMALASSGGGIDFFDRGNGGGGSGHSY